MTGLDYALHITATSTASDGRKASEQATTPNTLKVGHMVRAAGSGRDSAASAGFCVVTRCCGGIPEADLRRRHGLAVGVDGADLGNLGCAGIGDCHR